MVVSLNDLSLTQPSSEWNIILTPLLKNVDASKLDTSQMSINDEETNCGIPKTIGASNNTADSQGQLAEWKNFYDILENAEL